MSEYTPNDEEWSTYALLNGKLDSVNDIIDAVDQEQDHDDRFDNYRVLIAELKRMYEKEDYHIALMRNMLDILVSVESEWAIREVKSLIIQNLPASE